MMYPRPALRRGLGDASSGMLCADGSTDVSGFECSEDGGPAQYTAETTGGAVATSSDGINWTSIINGVVTDVTELVRTGTPVAVPLYTPASTAAASVLSSPLVLLGGLGLLAVAILKPRGRH